MTLRTPALVLLPLSALLMAGCGGSGARHANADNPTIATPTPHAAGHAGKGRSATTGKGKPQATASSTTRASGAPAPTHAGAGTGGSSPVDATPPGTYTYDVSGTNSMQPGQHTGTATLAVAKPVGDRQHSDLSSDQGGGTQEDLLHQGDGTYLAHLVISAAGNQWEFKPARPVLGIPKSFQAGRTWSWTMTSTDGKTTVSYTATFARTETVTIGGTKVSAWVIDSTRKITGSFTVTETDTTDYDPSRLLELRTHSKANGTYSGLAFTGDDTSTLRSLRPS